MHLHLPHLIFSGPPLSDEPILSRLPAELATALRERNGCVAWQGVVHVRGACREPGWHSLRAASEGPDGFPNLYPELEPGDIAFAEEALGDQFILRDGRVLRLNSETGEVTATASTDDTDNGRDDTDDRSGIEQWFRALLADPATILGYEPTQALEAVGGKLDPGQLISVYPPFAISAESVAREFKPVAALTRRGWLAGLAAKMRGLPDGTEVEIKAP
jgi:hypothetical protein